LSGFGRRWRFVLPRSALRPESALMIPDAFRFEDKYAELKVPGRTGHMIHGRGDGGDKRSCR
jgi:hypothetical protein